MKGFYSECVCWYVAVAHLDFALEPLVLHRWFAESVAAEAQIVARHQSYGLGLNDNLQVWTFRRSLLHWFLWQPLTLFDHNPDCKIPGQILHTSVITTAEISFCFSGAYLMVSGTVGPQCCPGCEGSQSGDPWCSLAPPSASAACGSGFPRAAAPSGSTPPCHLSCGTTQDISSNDYARHQNPGTTGMQTPSLVWTQLKNQICFVFTLSCAAILFITVRSHKAVNLTHFSVGHLRFFCGYKFHTPAVNQWAILNRSF